MQSLDSFKILDFVGIVSATTKLDNNKNFNFLEYYKFEFIVLMVKGFSDNGVKIDDEIKESKKEKKGLAAFLKGKKFTYTLPGKKQINIFGSIVLGLNMILILLVILYLKNQEFHDFIFNVGR